MHRKLSSHRGQTLDHRKMVTDQIMLANHLSSTYGYRPTYPRVRAMVYYDVVQALEP